MATQEEIQEVWARFDIQPTGQDMSNECRLAARVLDLEHHGETPLERDIREVLNKHSAESSSNTPDFMLAEFIVLALQAYNRIVNRRDRWYGINPKPGQLKCWEETHNG